MTTHRFSNGSKVILNSDNQHHITSSRIESLDPKYKANKSVSWLNLAPHKIYKQLLCASCFAEATANAVRMQNFIATKNSSQISIDELLSCTRAGDCSGGSVIKLIKFIENRGYCYLAKNPEYAWCSGNIACNGSSRKHFEASDVSSLIPSCHQNTRRVFTPISNVKTIAGTNHQEILDVQECTKRWITRYGPVVGNFHVFSDFMGGNFDIYVEKESARYVGDHSVVVVGFGEVGGVSYWECINSWGIDWGSRGTFKIAMYPHNKRSCLSRMSSLPGKLPVGGFVLFTTGRVEDVKDDIGIEFSDGYGEKWVLISLTCVLLIITAAVVANFKFSS